MPPLLTPGEYEDLPEEVKQQLAAIQHQPMQDTKSTAYRRRFGARANGQLPAPESPLSCWDGEATI